MLYDFIQEEIEHAVLEITFSLGSVVWLEENYYLKLKIEWVQAYSQTAQSTRRRILWLLMYIYVLVSYVTSHKICQVSNRHKQA